jgi:hypothetical protein
MSVRSEAYMALWVQLDEMWEAGLGESSEADALRDRMEGPWYALTEQDREEVERALAKREAFDGR